MLIDPGKDPCILIVEDHDANVRLLEHWLCHAGYRNFFSTRDSREALPLWRQLRPDIVLLDLHMPHLDGYTVIEQLRAHGDDTYVPIIVLTADTLPEARKRALSLGADDFVTKPFDGFEVVVRIRNLLQTRFLHLALSTEGGPCSGPGQSRLELVQVEMLQRLATATESRDDCTGRHTQRVGMLAQALAAAAGWPSDKLAEIRSAAALHDIGKIGIPDSILLKPGRLTPEEFEIIKTHSKLGARILGGSHFPVLQLGEQIALYHHEKWNGQGYYGMAGPDIPLAARIVAIADVFDVLTHVRPYKQAWSQADALAWIEREGGTHFDPTLVPQFLELVHGPGLLALNRALLASDSEVIAMDTAPVAVF